MLTAYASMRLRFPLPPARLKLDYGLSPAALHAVPQRGNPETAFVVYVP